MIARNTLFTPNILIQLNVYSPLQAKQGPNGVSLIYSYVIRLYIILYIYMYDKFADNQLNTA